MKPLKKQFATDPHRSTQVDRKTQDRTQKSFATDGPKNPRPCKRPFAKDARDSLRWFLISQKAIQLFPFNPHPSICIRVHLWPIIGLDVFPSFIRVKVYRISCSTARPASPQLFPTGGRRSCASYPNNNPPGGPCPSGCAPKGAPRAGSYKPRFGPGGSFHKPNRRGRRGTIPPAGRGRFVLPTSSPAGGGFPGRWVRAGCP